MTEKAKQVHGNKYSYHEFDDVSVVNKIKILCPTHGEFEQSIYAHLRGQGCPNCAGERRKYTTKDFIKDATEKFGNKFDYSKSIYTGRRNKVCIMCKELITDDNPNGEFWQKPFVHIESRSGMPFMGKRGKTYSKITNKELIKTKTIDFVEKAKKIHGNKIDFSKTTYTGCQQKAIFICPIHGEFKSFPSNILKGHGCPKCANNLPMSKKDFIVKARKVHGAKYDYLNAIIGNADDKICIVCPIHGEFYQSTYHHLKGHGCSKCSRNKKLSNEEFITKANELHGNKYDYSKVNYTNSYTKICITCPKHGEFWQTPRDHLKGINCPKCSESSLEEEMSQFLQENKIKYEREKKYANIKFKREMPFDFYLPDYNTIIECQGEQHFEQNHFFGDKDRIIKDKIKHQKAIENNLKILYFTNTMNYKKYLNTLIYDKNNLFNDKNKLLKEIKKG